MPSMRLKMIRPGWDLQNHINTVHLEIDRLTCNLCQKLYSAKQKLQIHLKSAHHVKKSQALVNQETTKTRDQIKDFSIVIERNMVVEKCAQRLKLRNDKKLRSIKEVISNPSKEIGEGVANPLDAAMVEGVASPLDAGLTLGVSNPSEETDEGVVNPLEAGSTLVVSNSSKETGEGVANPLALPGRRKRITCRENITLLGP